MKKVLFTFLIAMVLTFGSLSAHADDYNCSTTVTAWEWWEFAPGMGAWVPHTYEVWYPCDNRDPLQPPPEV